MTQIFAIAVGGSMGALMRFWVANGIYEWVGRGFPHGTLFVNVSGSFLMGLLTELMLQRFALSVEYRAAILVGFLGAYTTFSTFAVETLYLLEEGSLLKAFLNMFLSVALCLTAVWIGLIMGRRLFSGEALRWFGPGLPYGMLAVSALVACLLGFAAEVLFRQGDWPLPWRTAAIIVVLGMTTTLSTLSLALHLADRADLPASAGLFAINGVIAMSAIWAGISMGRQL